MTARTSLKVLHGESIETAVDHSHCTGHKSGCFTDEIMYRAAKFFRTTKTFERGLTDNILTTLGQTAVWICQQRTVLVGQEESWRNSIHTDIGSEFGSNFIGPDEGKSASG